MKNRNVAKNRSTSLDENFLKGNDESKFNEACKICMAMFHNQINGHKNGSFNHAKLESIRATVKGALKHYDLDVFQYLNNDMIAEFSEQYGEFQFTPALLLNSLKLAKEKLTKEKHTLNDSDKKCDKNLQSAPLHSLVPDIFDGKRLLPNVFLRSALFGIVRTGRRQFVKDEAVTSMSQYEVYFTGEQFDQNDLTVLDSLIFMVKQKKLESEIKLSMYEFCKFMDYSQSKTNRDAIKSRINRLQLGQIKIKFNQKIYAGSFIDDYYTDEDDGKIAIRLNKKLLSLFSTSDYTLFNKKIQESLGESQLARWLFHFYESHQISIPFKLDYLKKLSRSDSEQKIFNRTLKSSLQQLKKAYQQNQKFFEYKIQKSCLYVSHENTNRIL